MSSVAAGRGFPSNRKQGGFSLQRTYKLSEIIIDSSRPEEFEGRLGRAKRALGRMRLRNKLACLSGVKKGHGVGVGGKVKQQKVPAIYLNIMTLLFVCFLSQIG